MPRSRTAKSKNAAVGAAPHPPVARDDVGGEIVAHLRTGREAIRKTWVAELARRGFARLLTPEETEAESARIYDALIECLETGRYHSAQAYAQDMAERDVFRGIGAKQVIGRLLVLRDVCGRALYERCGRNPVMEAGVRDVYEPVVNRMLTIVAMAFLQERERAVGRGREQLGALVEAGKALAAERSLDAVLQRIVEVACRNSASALGVRSTNSSASSSGRIPCTRSGCGRRCTRACSWAPTSR